MQPDTRPWRRDVLPAGRKEPARLQKRRVPKQVVVETVGPNDETLESIDIHTSSTPPRNNRSFELVREMGSPASYAGTAISEEELVLNMENPLSDIFDMVTETFAPWNLNNFFGTNPNQHTTASVSRSRKPMRRPPRTLDLEETTSVECTLEDSLGVTLRGTRHRSKCVTPPRMGPVEEGRSPDGRRFVYV